MRATAYSGPDEVQDLAGGPPSRAESDIAFVRDMVPHHQQALEMTALAERSGAGRDVRLLAERMSGVADRRGRPTRAVAGRPGPLPPDDHGRHGGDHEALMPGMLTDAQMAALTAARGPEFDRLFLPR